MELTPMDFGFLADEEGINYLYRIARASGNSALKEMLDEKPLLENGEKALDYVPVLDAMDSVIQNYVFKNWRHGVSKHRVKLEAAKLNQAFNQELPLQ